MAKNKSEAYRKSSIGADKELTAILGQREQKVGLNADWAQVPHDVLFNIIWAVDQIGGSVTFSTTKNGAAYVVRLYVGAPYQPSYFDGDNDGRERLRAYAEGLVDYAVRSG